MRLSYNAQKARDTRLPGVSAEHGNRVAREKSHPNP